MVTIKDIYPICTAPEGIPLVIVKVVTSEPGLYGIGCATYTQRWMTVAHAVTNYMKPLLVGKDVTRIEDIWQMSMVSAYWRNGPVLNNAISGVDEALWDIKGKKLGVIGLGAIGCEVANAAAALGMEVYGYDPFISVNAAWMLSRSVKHIMDVNTIYKDCDYITVHVPLLDSTKEMINKDAFDQMKDGVVILNYARDLLVNDDDMAEALKSGKVKKYITDFPNAKTSAMEGVIATPHLGASTEESEDNCAVMAADELKDYLENGNIKNSVNFPNCDMGTCVAVGRIAICHKNIPNMISQFTKILGAEGLNIADMTNKSKGEYAYTLIDLESAASKEALDELKAIEGVSRVRVVK